MDIPILTAAIILLFIAAAEIFFLFCCPKVNSFPLTIVVPVRCDDGDFESKLIYLSFLLNKSNFSNYLFLFVILTITIIIIT